MMVPCMVLEQAVMCSVVSGTLLSQLVLLHSLQPVQTPDLPISQQSPMLNWR
jgi:hypothetical protein